MSHLKDKFIPKLKATSIHLSLSLLIFMVILYYILYHWYPEPFFTAQGGWQGIQLMAVVDLVLGPLLTFIIFNHLKKRKEIIFDLSLIAVVQISALTWGGYQVYSQRPIALVFWNEEFYTVTQDDYLSQGIKIPDFSQYSNHIPPLIYSRPVKTSLEMEEFQALSKQFVPIYAQVSLYENIEDNLKNIFEYEVNIKEITTENTQMKSQLEKIVGSRINDFKYIALKAKYQNMILVMNENGWLVGSVKAPYLK